MKKRKKVVITVISAAAAVIMVIGIIIYIFIASSVVVRPQSKLHFSIGNYIEEYNSSCEADKKVRIDNYYEGGPTVHCDLSFSGETIPDDEMIISFFLKFHNEFGYNCFCNEEANSDVSGVYDNVYFQFDNIRLSYGDKMLLPAELDDERDNIDASIHGIYKSIEIASETLSSFKGAVYMF